MSRWRFSSWWLLAAVLAVVVAVPVVVKAFGVESWIWLAVSAALTAAFVGPSAKLVADKIGRQVQQREESRQALAGAALGRGLLRVRDVDDPTRLGIRPAKLPAGYSMTSGMEGEVTSVLTPSVPVYVARDCHAEVVSHLGPGSFVLLIGDSAAGKSRLAYEAMRMTLPGHRLVVPDGRSALPVSVAEAAGQSSSVLWLDDIERFLGSDGLTMSMVDRMRGTKGHRVIIATIRREELNRLDEQAASAPELATEVRRILSQATRVSIERHFSETEVEVASKLAWDIRIADALRHSDTYGLAEYLAAGPELLARWQNGWAPGTHPRAAALVAAAIDCRRAGWNFPLPIDLLNATHEFCLNSKGGERLRPESLESAWKWVQNPLFATAALLESRESEKVHVSDYLVDHVQRTLSVDDHVSNEVVQVAIDAADAVTAGDLAATMVSSGRYTLAYAGLSKATNLLRDEIGAEHPDTLTSRSNAASVLQWRGDLAGAEAEHRVVLEARMRVLGAEHPDTLISRNNLATVLRARGDLAGAEREHYAELEACKRVLGAEHPDTLTSRNNLAVVLRARGDLAGAEAEHRVVLEARMRVLGAEHPSTLTSRSNVASVLWARGDLAGAEAEHRAVLEARMRVLGAEHPDTLTSRNNLARVLRDKDGLGDPAGGDQSN